jgi:hypothetical protein
MGWFWIIAAYLLGLGTMMLALAFGRSAAEEPHSELLDRALEENRQLRLENEELRQKVDQLGTGRRQA